MIFNREGSVPFVTAGGSIVILLGGMTCNHWRVHLLLLRRMLAMLAFVLAVVVAASVVVMHGSTVWVLYDFNFGLRLATTAPVDCWPGAHVPAQNFFVV